MKHLSTEVNLEILWLDIMHLLPHLSHDKMTKLPRHKIHHRSRILEPLLGDQATQGTQTKQEKFMFGRLDLRMGKLRYFT